MNKMKKGEKHTTLIIARISKNLEQRDIAKRVCEKLNDPEAITPNILSKLENGWRRSVTLEVGEALAEVLGITLNEIKAGGIRVKS